MSSAAGAPLRVGLIGHPVAHSRSPAMQQAAFDALGIAARYELWDTPLERLPERMASLRAPGMLGANVTIPHKLAVVPLLDALAPEVERVTSAVNTIVREQVGAQVRLVGHSTDVAGIAAALRELGAEPAGRRVVVLGSGGMAHTVAGYVCAAGAAGEAGPAMLTLAARNHDAAVALLAEISRRGQLWRRSVFLADLIDVDQMGALLAQCDLLVNATSVGMADATACPFPPALLQRMPAGGAVLDAVYAPHETALVRAARAAGLAASDGLPLLLHQGAAAFTLWTSRPAPLEVMRAALGM